MKAVLIGAAALMVAAGAHAATFRAGVLEVSQAWSRPAVAGVNGVGYLTVANRGPAADTLVAVESPLAARIEMHRSSMVGGVMSMTSVTRVGVPAQGQAVFGPGGYHLMLIGLKKALLAGDEVPATLTFASGAHLKITLAVGTGSRPQGPAKQPVMGPMGGMDMSH